MVCMEGESLPDRVAEGGQELRELQECREYQVCHSYQEHLDYQDDQASNNQHSLELDA